MKEILALYNAGRLQEADAAARDVLAREPHNVTVMNILGVIAHHVGRNDLAIQWYERAIRISPQDGILFNNLGEAYRALGQGNEAMAAYRRAIELDPGNATARNNLAIVLANLGALDEAMQVWRELITHHPDFTAAMNNLGSALLERGEAGEAAQWHRRAIQADPANASAHSNVLRDVQHIPETTPEQLLEEHRAWWRQHGAPRTANVQAHQNTRDPDRPLRIGWVSPDFREHSVAMFLEPIFEHHDRTRMQFYAYSDVANEDEVTARLKNQVPVWRSIRGARDEQVDQQIRADAIDILIDLAGHTAGNRATLFARQPAPVQVSYLGYPATTGIETIQYRITDALADPIGLTEAQHTEKLIRLRRIAWCYRPPSSAPPVSELPATRNGYVTFGSFNSFAKVNATVIQAWAEILKQVQGAKLLLKANGLDQTTVQTKLRQTFADLGVAGDRIIMIGRVTDIEDHLAQYAQIDLALDPFPYNGTTTTCESLWMGVPVVTVAGNEHRSRVGVSLLTNVGLEVLVASDIHHYIAKAVATAADLPALSELRMGLRNRMQHSALRDEPGFVREFESALQSIWRAWCAQR